MLKRIPFTSNGKLEFVPCGTFPPYLDVCGSLLIQISSFMQFFIYKNYFELFSYYVGRMNQTIFLETLCAY